jgi:hypothetical protein
MQLTALERRNIGDALPVKIEYGSAVRSAPRVRLSLRPSSKRKRGDRVKPVQQAGRGTQDGSLISDGGHIASPASGIAMPTDQPRGRTCGVGIGWGRGWGPTLVGSSNKGMGESAGDDEIKVGSGAPLGKRRIKSVQEQYDDLRRGTM